MKVRVTAILAVLALLVGAIPALAQVQTGEITGRVSDDTGAVLPGATVTLTSPVLIQAQTATSSETGSFRFTLIPIGTYSVKFELPGFKTVVREGIVVNIGFTAQINQQLAISTVQETVTVSGESPIVDTKATTARTTFDLDSLQNIPSARDPWVMLQRVPNISMDRINVGGNQSGQQSNYISRGSATGNNKWALDGVDITDMSATGASPMYYDFDMMQEMQVTTGGADASQQTGGVGINFVTRSGTNRFKGSGRLYNTNERFSSDNVTPEIKAAGAGSGAPIQNINDMGVEAGGPIKRDKLWFWGSYGTQDIKVGVVNFYKNTPECRPPGVPVGDIAKILPTDVIRDCLATDLTTLNNYNAKLTWAPMRNNKFNFQNTWAEKVRNARDASDTRPLETAYRQKAVADTFGTFGWDTGPGPIWKASDQHVFTDRLLVDINYAHVGNNFTLTFQDPSQGAIQRRFDITSGAWSRSFNESVFIRPNHSVDLTTSYFLPNTAGGDHALKFGYRWRTSRGESISHTGGNADARYANSTTTCASFANGCEADLWRDGSTNYDLMTHAFYAQDTYSVKKFTFNVGFRWDRQSDQALPSSVAANPIIPGIMPAIEFPGVDSGIAWNDFSPRVGMTYDIRGTGRSVARASYSMTSARCNLASWRRTTSRCRRSSSVTHGPTSTPILSCRRTSSTPRPSRRRATHSTQRTRPASSRPGPSIRTSRTIAPASSWLVSSRKSCGTSASRSTTSGAGTIGSSGPILSNWDSSNFQPFQFTTPANCGPTANCDPVTYFRATSSQPSPFVYTNVPDRFRNYNGVEFALTKRYSDRWMANFSFAFNDAVDYYDSPASYSRID